MAKNAVIITEAAVLDRLRKVERTKEGWRFNYGKYRFDIKRPAKAGIQKMALISRAPLDYDREVAEELQMDVERFHHRHL